MLDLSLDWADLDQKLIGRDCSYKLGASSAIELFPSSVLVKQVCPFDDGFSIWVGESDDPLLRQQYTAQPQEDYGDIFAYEGIGIVVRCSSEGHLVNVSRTSAGGCPIYISLGINNRIVISWRYEHAARNIANIVINKDACKTFIDYGANPVRDQIIVGMYMLWPGETAIITADSIEFHEANSHPVCQPTSLSDGALACEAFLDLVQQRLELVMRRSKSPLIEYSGGMDSSVVAIAASRCRSSVSSYGLIQTGVSGIQQLQRRNELIKRLGLLDYAHPADCYSPIDALRSADTWWTPYDDNHRMSCVDGISNHPAGDFDLVLTGIGGDEVLMPHTYVRQPWEVRGSISTSAIASAWARADMFLRAGIWPVSPFLDQGIVDFCRSIPRELKSGRILNILVLARSGLSDGYLFPRYREDYGNTMRKEMMRTDVDILFTSSIVADLGICDVTDVIEKARKELATGFSYETMVMVWKIKKLDAVLSNYM